MLLTHYVVLTEEGIEKNKDLNLNRTDIDLVKTVVRKAIADK